MSEEISPVSEEVLPIEAAHEAATPAEETPVAEAPASESFVGLVAEEATAVSPLISGLYVTEADGKPRPATPEETAAYLKVIQANGGKQTF